MGCKESKQDINVRVSLDSRYFEDSEITCTKSINSPVQELFREAQKKLKSKNECLDMKLCIEGTYIDSCSKLSLKDLGVYENSKLVIGVRTNNVKFTVLIQSETPTKASVSMKKQKTILDLKRKLGKNANPEDFIVLFRNIALPDITPIWHLHLDDNEIVTMLAKTDNYLVALWKYKTPGFIIEGLCMNSDCQAYRQRVCIEKGFGQFDISHEFGNLQDCPSCGATVSTVVSMGVAWCKYSAEFLNEKNNTEKEIIEKYFEFPKDWNLVCIEVTQLYSE